MPRPFPLHSRDNPRSPAACARPASFESTPQTSPEAQHDQTRCARQNPPSVSRPNSRFASSMFGEKKLLATLLALHDARLADMQREDVLRAVEDAVSGGQARCISMAGDVDVAIRAVSLSSLIRVIVIPAQWPVEPAEMLRPSPLNSQQQPSRLDAPGRKNHCACLDPGQGRGTMYHHFVDHPSALSQFEINDGAVQADRNPLRLLHPIAVRERQLRLRRPSFKRRRADLVANLRQEARSREERVTPATQIFCSLQVAGLNVLVANRPTGIRNIRSRFEIHIIKRNTSPSPGPRGATQCPANGHLHRSMPPRISDVRPSRFGESSIHLASSRLKNHHLPPQSLQLQRQSHSHRPGTNDADVTPLLSRRNAIANHESKPIAGDRSEVSGSQAA
jgi:hypothetical protein